MTHRKFSAPKTPERQRKSFGTPQAPRRFSESDDEVTSFYTPRGKYFAYAQHINCTDPHPPKIDIISERIYFYSLPVMIISAGSLGGVSLSTISTRASMQHDPHIPQCSSKVGVVITSFRQAQRR